MNVRLVVHGDSWVVEELDAKGGVERRFAYQDEERARFVYLRKIAIRSGGTILAMLFGVGVDGVGQAPMFDYTKAERALIIEPMTWHRHVMGDTCRVTLSESFDTLR